MKKVKIIAYVCLRRVLLAHTGGIFFVKFFDFTARKMQIIDKPGFF